MCDFKKAIEDARQAITLNPKYAKAHGRLAHALRQLSRFKEARDVFKAGWHRKLVI
jgi:Flp pilus assembly protein TadD